MSKLIAILKALFLNWWKKPAPVVVEDKPPVVVEQPQGDPEMSKPQPSEYPSTTVLRIVKANHDNKDACQRVWLETKLDQEVMNVWFVEEATNWRICQGRYDKKEGCFVSLQPWWDFPPKYFVTCKAIAPHDMRTYKTQVVDRDGGEYNKPEVRPANMP